MSPRQTLAEAMEQIDRLAERRRHAPTLREEHVTMAHGSGGKATHDLVQAVFAPELGNPALDALEDAAVLPLGGDAGRLAFTTDAFVVKPLFFPGGDIGSLAIHGTVNDLAVAGAVPLALSAAVILEEGFPIADLRRVVASMRRAAEEVGVPVVAGDTKVVERGHGDGLYVTTTGVGLVRPGARLSAAAARPGDAVLVSGAVGDHGVAILLAREELAMESDLESDSAPLHRLAGALVETLGADLHCMRDATRGGVATALNEIAQQSRVGVELEERAFPIRAEVRGACEILGLDPLHLANEGKLLAVVDGARADEALAALRSLPEGRQAALVGRVVASDGAMVTIETGIGGRRVLDMLVGDALPRIC